MATTESDAEDREQLLARAFEADRPRLLRLEYTFGSLVEAEDCVQDAWARLRWLDDPTAVCGLAGWLATTVSRLTLDALDSARARAGALRRHVAARTSGRRPRPDPADQVTLDESVSMALLIALEQFTAAERTAFVLHDVFSVPFSEIAELVGRSPAVVRQLAARARRRVEGGRPRTPTTAAAAARSSRYGTWRGSPSTSPG